MCIALRVASAYCTTRVVTLDGRPSRNAVLVITRTPPLNLLAKKRKKIHEQQRDLALANIYDNLENELLTFWHDQWERNTKGRWTRRLIKEIKPWKTRAHGTIDYWLTQALTGHGCYGAYLHKYGKLQTAECWFCNHPTDDALRTFFACDAWATRRSKVEADIGDTLAPDTMIETMLRNDHTWSAINSFIHEVMKKKTDEERRRQNLP